MPERQVPPTTAREIEAQRRTHSQTDTDEEAGDEVCGEDLARGGVCERPAGECPYHSKRDV